MRVCWLFWFLSLWLVLDLLRFAGFKMLFVSTASNNIRLFGLTVVCVLLIWFEFTTFPILKFVSVDCDWFQVFWPEMAMFTYRSLCISCWLMDLLSCWWSSSYNLSLVIVSLYIIYFCNSVSRCNLFARLYMWCINICL